MQILKIAKVFGLLLALSIFPAVTFAKDGLTAKEIIVKSRLAFYYAGSDMRAKVRMELINKDEKIRVRELTMLRKDYDEGGNQKYFMYFHKPADVQGTTFMVYKYPDRDDRRWLFIPAINLVKRVAANDKYSSFVGSDFTYEDISGRNPAEDIHALLRKERVNGRNYFVIESIPKETSVYTKKISWIDRINFLPLKEEFYDNQNELYRRFEAKELKDINGILTVIKRIMKNVKTDHRTEVTFEEIEYNLGIEDNIFSERYLRKPPLKWFR